MKCRFQDELSRFIPVSVQERTLKQDKFKDFLINETKSLLTELRTLIANETTQDKFYI